MFINISNSPSSKWSKEKLSAAKEIVGEIVDISLPKVSPDATEEDIDKLTIEIFNKVRPKLEGNSNNVMIINGETEILVFSLIIIFQANFPDIKIVEASSSSELVEKMKNDGLYKYFKSTFLKFREYPKFSKYLK